MKTSRLVTLLALVLSLSVAAGAWGVDDGQTQPRVSDGTVNLSTTSVDIIPLTSGSGNVKGFQCLIPGTSNHSVRLHFFVDGGAAQTIDPREAVFHTDANGDRFTEVPLNVRFETSIRVNLQKVSGTSPTAEKCAVSWGLD